MEKVLRLLIVLLTNVFIIGCPSGMYCEPIDDVGQCDNTSLPQACVSMDGSRCGYRVKGKYFYCVSCDPFICDDATEAAMRFCYGYSTADISMTDQDQVVDESIIAMKVEAFKDALELLKATSQ